MRSPILGRSACGIFAAAVIVAAGCSGSQSGMPASPASGGANAAHQNHARSRTHDSNSTAFTTKGEQLLLNGTPFFVKGVDYSPNQINRYPDANPLDDANEPIWKADLDEMRADGVNAVKVYNISLDTFGPYLGTLGPDFKLQGYETGKIGKFLDYAWNGGNKPIYVVLSIAFQGASVTIPTYTSAVKGAFEAAAKEYAAKPAFMGFSIGNEINNTVVIGQPDWWAGLNQMVAGVNAGYAAANAQKITTTTMIDDGVNDNLLTVQAGEKNGFKVDVWGVNSYRGYTFTNIWQQLKNDTKKPAIISEYGYSSGYYPASSATYSDTLHYCTNYPHAQPTDPNAGLPGQRPWEDIKELPTSNTANPRSQFLADLVKANATEIYEHWAGNPGNLNVGDGGFYFEWNDEWWKSGWPFPPHIGGEGNRITTNAVFPGCYRDEGWFGLNEDKASGPNAYPFPSPFPARSPDIRVPRPSLDAIKAVFQSEQ